MVTPEGEKGVATMQAVHAWLEEQIRTRPAQWLWIHDRWRAARRKGLL
jgi:KDO2-lipid IV(A) lauroyltransferase